jgi:hypothetical protein
LVEYCLHRQYNQQTERAEAWNYDNDHRISCRPIAGVSIAAGSHRPLPGSSLDLATFEAGTCGYVHDSGATSSLDGGVNAGSLGETLDGNVLGQLSVHDGQLEQNLVQENEYLRGKQYLIIFLADPRQGKAQVYT